MNILYVHGLGGTKNGSTSRNLKELCLKNNINFYSFDVPFEPFKAISEIENQIKKNNIDIVISSSLGAFYTLNATLEIKNIKTIIINPALDVYNDILNNFGKGEKKYRGVREDRKENYVLDDDFYHLLLILQKQFEKKIKGKTFTNWIGYFSDNDEYFSHINEFKKYSKNVFKISDTHHINCENLEKIINNLII